MGYLISEESGETFPNPAREIGKACILPDNTSGGAQIECESTETVCEVPDEGTFVFTLDSKAVVFKQVYDSVTGLIDLVTLPDSILETLDDVVSLQLTTSSPVWQEWGLSISESANAIMFDYEFTSDAEGLITVYMDGRAVRRLDARYAAEGLQASPLIAVGDVYPGEHKLAFRLDPFTAVASEASISNIRFIRFEGAGVVDIDGDGLDGEEDLDDDGDRVKDTSDLFPEDPNEWSDNDGDGVGDAIDNDDDNDQFADEIDNCRLVANSDQSDADGHKDGEEQFLGSDPLDKNSRPWIICMDTCASDGSCDAFATAISAASTIKSDDAYINYFKVVTGIIEENELTISGNVLVGIEAGQVIIQH